MIEVYVNPATETVYVEFNPEVLPFAELLAMIEHAGYGTAAPTRLAGKGRVARNPEVGGRRR